MHIALLEDEPVMSARIISRLKQEFAVEITLFANVGDFLRIFPDINPVPDLIITDRSMPLLTYCEDVEFKRLMKEWNGKFPIMEISNWEGKNAGERVIRLVKESDTPFAQVPMILHSSYGESSIAPDVLGYPKVWYCNKTLGYNNLVSRTRSVLFPQMPAS